MTVTSSILIRGLTMYLYEHEAVSDAIRAAGDFYEAAILDDLAASYPRQRTIVDVGANIGNHSLYWSAFVEHAAILAFEPVPDNHSLLLANVGHRGVVCFRTALGDRDGTAGMTLDPSNMGRSHIAEDGALVVPMMRLDTLGPRDVSLLKVDVEGHQADVLAGARATIERDRPILLVEDEEGTVAQALDGLDYRMEREWPGSNHLWVPR